MGGLVSVGRKVLFIVYAANLERHHFYGNVVLWGGFFSLTAGIFMSTMYRKDDHF